MSRFDSVPLRIGEFIIAKAHQVHHHAFGSKVRWGADARKFPASCAARSQARLSRNDISFRNAVAPQEIARGIRAIHLEAQPAFSKAGCQAEIMEHGCRVEKFRIKNSDPYAFQPRRPKNRRG